MGPARGCLLPLPFPKDFQALCPSCELAVAEEAVGRFELPELPQVIFYAMLLSKAERLGVLHERTLRIIKQRQSQRRRARQLGNRKRTQRLSRRMRARQPRGLPPHQTMTSMRRGGTMGEKRQRELGTSPSPFIMAFPLLRDTGEMALFRRATHPPRPLPEDYHNLCLHFSLPEAEGAVLDFRLPKMVQATFYAMLSNNAVELGVVSSFIISDRKSNLVGLRWTCFEAWTSRTSHELREARLRQRPVTVETRGSSDGQEESSLEFQAAGATWRGQSGWLPPRKMRSLGGHLPLFIKEGKIPREFHSFLSRMKTEKSRRARERMKMNLFANFANTDHSLDNRGLYLRFDYRGLYLRFDLGVATRCAHDSHVPEIEQAIFYAMSSWDFPADSQWTIMMWAMRKLDWGPVESWLVDIDRRLKGAQASQLANPLAGATPPGDLTRRRVSSFPTFQDTTHTAEYVRDNLYWSVSESSSLHPNLLPLHFVALCPEFDHIVAMQFAHVAQIPKMVQAIFYAVVINDSKAFEQGDHEKPDVQLTGAEVGHCRGMAAVYRGKAQGHPSTSPCQDNL
ncbi:LOW QUALITY PROTEIN: hypothetical protein Cgig2_032198 [Carnegiea gigantea]|uniref:Uncharacterized protein n=1 Tax=Carnegiea gigantea TaxID=171969 RepID=A0A9Q1QBU7_9CARY|nr:LOW QUALITY PROTEIN: hypothetical protein Cgig2_032198 [Carnegiea gigantea]